eukprot:6180135-Pleurochrysis_carterae.AAC.1
MQNAQRTPVYGLLAFSADWSKKKLVAAIMGKASNDMRSAEAHDARSLFPLSRRRGCGELVDGVGLLQCVGQLLRHCLHPERELLVRVGDPMVVCTRRKTRNAVCV